MQKSIIYTAIPVFAITTAIWIVGITNHTFLASEVWIYVGMYLIPAGGICGSIWLLFRKQIWQRVLGLVILVPSTGAWMLSLLLVYHGFKIH